VTAELVLRLRGARFAYGRRVVLAEVDLEVRSGEVWFLIGPNGSGKSTLLRGVLGLLKPQAGTIKRSPGHAGPEVLGFVPQRCELDPTLPTTVREFVSLGLVGLRVRRAERPGRLAFALGHAGLSGLAAASYWSLSGGQRQRALLARALVRRPRLMILDEPTEGLDVSSERAFLDALLELNRSEGLTLLVVTHKLALAERHATHVALFHEGRVVAGPRAQVLGGDALGRLFGSAGTTAAREATA
jgi:ABC-type Mn2+/Zn2+ transport system ATPase subunit